MSTPYGRMWERKKETGRNISDLLVLAPNNDPFNAGSPAHRQKAEWFASLWERYGYTDGVHIRRVHYQHVSQESPDDFDGTLYENSDRCYGHLQDAAKYARHLDLVDPQAFVDRRNPEPRVFMSPKKPEEGEVGWDYEFPEWCPPDVRPLMLARMPELYVTGYEYEDFLQPCHVELWAEKSTMNDVLLPLCERHAANLVSGLGEMSITSVVELLGRVKALGKPCRILYVSDFDPAGTNMPVSVARKVEFGIERFAPDADIKLDPLVLTAGQVEEYVLPRTPIKDEDLRKGKWEAIHGRGAVELDALEALCPGELRRVVESAILEFRDEGLPEKVRVARETAQSWLEVDAEVALPEYEAELRRLHEGVEAVVGRYREVLRELEEEIAPYRERMETLRLAVQDELDGLEPDLPELPEGEVGEDSGGLLLDSRRDYFEQLASYKEHQNGGAG